MYLDIAYLTINSCHVDILTILIDSLSLPVTKQFIDLLLQGFKAWNLASIYREIQLTYLSSDLTSIRKLKCLLSAMNLRLRLRTSIAAVVLLLLSITNALRDTILPFTGSLSFLFILMAFKELIIRFSALLSPASLLIGLFMRL